MCSAEVRGTDDRPEIVRVLNIIQQKKERRLSLFSCDLQNVVHFRIFIRCRHRDHTLVFLRLRELIQTFFFHKMNNGIMLFCLSYDRAHRSVLTAVQHKKLVDRLAGTKRLKHRIASLYF